MELKSAYELAMERLRRRDADAGVDHRPLTDAQKAAVAEIRSFYQAKLAELEILHQSKVRAIADPAEREMLETEFRRERERLTGERDRKVDAAREA